MPKYMTQVPEFNHQSRLLAKMPAWATASTPDSGPVALAEWCHLRETGDEEGLARKFSSDQNLCVGIKGEEPHQPGSFYPPANVSAVCQSTGQPGPSSHILGLRGMLLSGLCWGRRFVGLPGMQHPLKSCSQRILTLLHRSFPGQPGLTLRRLPCRKDHRHNSNTLLFLLSLLFLSLCGNG